MASPFIGTFTPRLDDKGRLTLPARFRSNLEGDVVLTRGQENSIAVYPEAEFERIVARVTAAPGTQTARIVRRQIASGADPQSVDSQGRVSINPLLRSYAGIDRECVVSGAFDFFEIWDQRTWETYLSETGETFSTAQEGAFEGLL
ncbi:division/cell wall cluster transcriptional repressor MraZ [Rhodococcus aerolatus]